jgi:hypothetical protein
MKTLKIGDVTITSLIERDGPWRKPKEMFPAYDPAIGRRAPAKADITRDVGYRPLSRHSVLWSQCPLSGVKQTCRLGLGMSANDPGRVETFFIPQ